MLPKFFIITTVSDSLPFFKGQITELKKNFNVSLVSSPGDHLEQMVKEYNVKGFPVSMNREISVFKDVQSLWLLFKLFRKERPIIVHGNTPKASLLSMLAAWMCRVPVRIYYVHGLRYDGFYGAKKFFLMIMEKISCIFANEIIAVSEGVKNQLKLDRITDKEIHLIWNGSINGIDTDYFNPGKVEKIHIDGIESGDFVFGFVGRLVKDKGLEELVEAFLNLAKDKKNIKLLMLGSFEKPFSLSTEIVESININHQIIYVGRKEDVRPFYKSMDVLVLPSYREGLCGVILESSSMQLPVIASNIVGIKEVVNDHKSGILIPVKNIEYLQKSLELLYNDYNMRVEMSNNARDFAIHNFGQKKLWEQSLLTYTKILEKYV